MNTIKTVFASLAFAASACAVAGIPDSVYIQPVSAPDGGGMRLEWSIDNQQWKPASQGRVLGSDFGQWGSQKKLYHASIAQADDGLMAVVFQVNDRANQFAVTTTRDFIHWRPQDYPYMQGVGQCLEPVVNYADGQFAVTFHNRDGKYYRTTSRDLVHFTDPVAASDAAKASIVRVPYIMLQNLQANAAAAAAKGAREGELARDDASRFAGLERVDAQVKISAQQPLKISDRLMGIFFEDINYSADGGIWAQLLQNGDFEYDPSDRGNDRNWNTLTAWTVDESAVRKIQGVSAMNSHAIAITAPVSNQGFDGIYVEKGKKYDLSLYLIGRVTVTLREGSTVLAKATLSGGKSWKQVRAVLRPTATTTQAQLEVAPVQGEASIDMVSLMPQDTYKGHGLRRDLAETLAALHPRFMRFPGGCVTHGDGIGNIYNWKETIGDLRDRRPLRNIWGYHQSRQLGFYEFFQMCEDMGMEPLPVLAAGVPCQNSNTGGYGQQGGIPMDQMPAYIQDILDLIEWANGDASTEWGAKRIAQGHKKPFGLKMIGIGNEDLISPTFTERYLMISRAIKARYPEIEVCGTAGPFFNGADYEEGWRIAHANRDVFSLIDEHYYVSPGWYIWNQDYYDNYDRTAPKVYLGEWASHINGRQSTIETALSCALHYCNLERNGDVVEMSSYAPLLAREGHTQWNPDMIYFSATEVHPTVDYYGQMMCGQSAGDEYLASTLRVDNRQSGVRERLAISTVRDSRSGRSYIKLVNMLPCPVSAHVQLDGLLTAEQLCKTTTLTGRYDSRDARPQPGTVTLSPDCQVELPGYSFTVIEL